MVEELLEYDIQNSVGYDKVQAVETKLDELIDAIHMLHINDKAIMETLEAMSEAMHHKRYHHDLKLIKASKRSN